MYSQFGLVREYLFFIVAFLFCKYVLFLFHFLFLWQIVPSVFVLHLNADFR
jgi:hypothetical protein